MAHAVGSTLYVNNATPANCSDSAAGAGAVAQPYCSVQAAVDVAKPGDTVQVADGHYEPVDMKTSGTPSAPITVKGPDGLGGPSLVTPGRGSGAALTFDHVHDVVFTSMSFATNIDASDVAVVASSNITVNRSTIVGGPGNATAPAVAVDGQSSSFTLSRTAVWGLEAASAVAVAPGARGTVLTTDGFSYGQQPAVTAVDAPGTVVVSSNIRNIDGCHTAISVTGASTGTTIENNAIRLNTANCADGVGSPVVVSAGSTNGTVYDYNVIETQSAAAAPYNWAGQSYPTSSALQAATGQGAHDAYLSNTSGMTEDQLRAPLIDSADANAPGELSTDALGKPRVDDPLVPNTGTGVGYYDRGAVEFQDPYKLTATASAFQGPAPLTETVTATEDNPWNTRIASYTFDFGDGSAPMVSATPSASHTYTSVGSYTVQITATSANGATFFGAASLQVVKPAPLVPVLSAQHVPGQSSLTVSGDGYGTSDAWSITSYTVDFGDGTAPVTTDRYSAPARHIYAQPGTYTAKLTVKDDGGNTATTTQQVNVGSALVPFGPVRFLDTRYGTGAAKAKLGQGGVVRLKVTGVNGVPGTGVTAVTLNLTAVNATTGTWIAAYPDGTLLPTASNINVVPGQITSNLVTVPVSADGYVDLYNFAGSVDLVADVEGYYSTTVAVGNGASKAGFVTPDGPSRVLDTRYGTGTWVHKVGPGAAVTLQVPNGATRGASAVVLNVTETNATAGSWVGVDQAGGVPTTSVLNFSAGQISSNQVVVPIDSNGDVTLYNHAGDVDLVADVQGYVINYPSFPNPQGTGSPYFPLNPTRILDTRYGTGSTKAPLGSKSKLSVKVAGTNGVPAGARAVLVNLTGVNPTDNTWLSAYEGGTGLPNSSNLNLSANTVRAVLALVPVGPDGSIDIYNANGTADVVADIEGYYTG